MAEPELAFTRLAGEAGRGHLLVVGPSLGTSVEALWGAAARVLGETLEMFHIVAAVLIAAGIILAEWSALRA